MGNARIHYGVLGPVTAWRMAQEIDLGWARQRTVLAVLLLEMNRPVSLAAIVDAVWGERSLLAARRTVQTNISRLRRALHPGDRPGCRDDILLTTDAGYLLRGDPADLDATVFEQRLAEAGEHHGRGALVAAAQAVDAALALWRGEAFSGLASPRLEVERTWWRERQLAGLELRVAIQLDSGQHTEAVVELTRLVNEFPLREGLWERLMLALYRDGRQAEALRHYQLVRRRLAEELGVDPGPALQRLYQQILTGDPRLSEPRPVPEKVVAGAAAEPGTVPRQLPAAIGQFVGRASALDTLHKVAGRTADAPAGGTVVISAIDGTAGIGKTALAVHWAHQVADLFPDGQLYVDLLGYAPDEPMRATDALAMLLRSLGVPDRDIPDGLNERAAWYRSRLAGRRVLVILDNAWRAEQVRPLLPGSASCVAVVTSRDSLSGLVARDGAHRIALDLLPPNEAIGLLRALIGVRVDAEPAAAARLAEQCARLPLALRIAAEFAVANPDLSVSELTADLGDHQRRLDLLDAGGDERTAPRTVFSWSYQRLEPAARRMFRLMGLQPGVHLDRHAAASLAGTGLSQAERLLDRLARAHLIQPGGAGRYGMHNLLRDYASELVVLHDAEDERHAALSRLFEHYVETVAAAMDLVFPCRARCTVRTSAPASPMPSFADSTAALAWLDTQRATLGQIVAYAVGNGWPRHGIRLAIDLSEYLDTGGHLTEETAVCRHALDAARAVGDRAAEGEALLWLGRIDWWRGSYQPAAELLTEAKVVFRAIGDDSGEARALSNLGMVDEARGRTQQAAEKFQRAIVLLRKTGDRHRAAVVLGNLGALRGRQRQYATAIDHYQAALDVFCAVGDSNGQAQTLGRLGSVALRQGRYQQAVADLHRSVALFDETGDRSGQANALALLGEVDTRSGRFRQADDRLHRALTLCRDIGDRPSEVKVLCRLGLAQLAQGRTEPAARLLREALGLAREIGQPAYEAEALNGLGEVSLAAAEPGQARTHHSAALRAADQAGDVEEQARARAHLSRLEDLGATPQVAR